MPGTVDSAVRCLGLLRQMEYASARIACRLLCGRTGGRPGSSLRCAMFPASLADDPWMAGQCLSSAVGDIRGATGADITVNSSLALFAGNAFGMVFLMLPARGGTASTGRGELFSTCGQDFAWWQCFVDGFAAVVDDAWYARRWLSFAWDAGGVGCRLVRWAATVASRGFLRLSRRHCSCVASGDRQLLLGGLLGRVWSVDRGRRTFVRLK